jgi:hypothetical protein
VQLPAFSHYFIPLRSKYSPQHPVLKHPQSPFGIFCAKSQRPLKYSPRAMRQAVHWRRTRRRIPPAKSPVCWRNHCTAVTLMSSSDLCPGPFSAYMDVTRWSSWDVRCRGMVQHLPALLFGDSPGAL